MLSKHYTALFSAGSLSKRLPVRMAMIFDVSVSEQNGLPFFIFCGCLHQVEGIESKLDVLRSSSRFLCMEQNDVNVIVYGLCYAFIY